MAAAQSKGLITPKTAAVIGAGWSGLAAALILARAGRRVTLFEASRQLGGRARSVTFNTATDAGSQTGDDNELRLDNGQHILIGAYTEALRLIRVAGVDVDRALLRMPLDLRFADGFRLRGARLPYPLNLLSALAGCKSLSRAEAWAAVRMLARLRWRGYRIEPDMTVSSFLDANGQSGMLTGHLWDPLCVAALNTPPERASAQVFAHVLRDGLGGRREHSDLLIPRLDLGRLFPEPAAERLQAMGGRIELGAPIHIIAHRNGKFFLDSRDEGFSTVIIAVAPQHAVSLLDGLPELGEAGKRIAELAYEPIVTCYLQYAQDVALPAPMLGCTGGAAQWLFDRGQLSERSRHAGLLAAVMSGDGPHLEQPREAMEAGVVREIAAITGRAETPRWIRTITEKRATWSCRPGVQLPAMRTPLPGLFLAGDYIAGDYPATLEAAARNGAAAARAAIED